jgi:hypothetical protein
VALRLGPQGASGRKQDTEADAHARHERKQHRALLALYFLGRQCAASGFARWMPDF